MLFGLLLSYAAVAVAAPSNLAARQQSFSASFTRYNGCGGACDLFGGMTAAVSQNFFGVGPGGGAGPACGTCFSISSGVPGTVPITVKVTNLCPADGNPLCSQPDLSSTNSMGANIHLDLCGDDGAAATFFGTSGTELAAGTATKTGC